MSGAIIEKAPPSHNNKFSSMPSMLDTILVPFKLTSDFYKLAKVKLLKNPEQEIDTALRIISGPLSFTTGVLAVLQAVMQFGMATRIHVPSWVITITFSILGIIVCLFDLIQELIGIGRQFSLRKKLKVNNWKNLPEGSKQRAALVAQNLRFIRSNWLTINNNEITHLNNVVEENYPGTNKQKFKKYNELLLEFDQGKRFNLASRIAPWLVTEFDLVDETFLQQVEQGESTACNKAEQLLKEVDTQIKKKLIVHIVGIVSLILTVAGLILLSCGFPVFLPLALTSLGAAVGITRYLLGDGFFNQRGWGFSPSKCLPSWAQDNLVKRLIMKPIAQQGGSTLQPSTNPQDANRFLPVQD